MFRNSTDKSLALYDIIRSPCKQILDSLDLEYWIPRRGFRIPGTGFFSVIPDIFNPDIFNR